MNIFLKLIVINVSLASAYLVYLCVLDMLFVFVMEEKVSFLNNLPFLIIIMPFLSVYLSITQLAFVDNVKIKLFVLSCVFLVMAVASFFELLWVATHFHSMIGGST